jgi:hypothetical protein
MRRQRQGVDDHICCCAHPSIRMVSIHRTLGQLSLSIYSPHPSILPSIFLSHPSRILNFLPISTRSKSVDHMSPFTCRHSVDIFSTFCFPFLLPSWLCSHGVLSSRCLPALARDGRTDEHLTSDFFSFILRATSYLLFIRLSIELSIHPIIHPNKQPTPLCNVHPPDALPMTLPS